MVNQGIKEDVVLKGVARDAVVVFLSVMGVTYFQGQTLNSSTGRLVLSIC